MAVKSFFSQLYPRLRFLSRMEQKPSTADRLIFPGNSYSTPAGVRRYLSDRLLLNSRWPFYFQYIKTMLECRAEALRHTYDDMRWAMSSLAIFRHMEGCGAKFEIDGLDNLRREPDPVVIVGNHMSTAETMVLPCMVQPIKPVTFVVKEELVKARIFGPIMRARDPVVVGRKDPRADLETVLRRGSEELRKGRSVILFPEGHRNAQFNPQEFNSLGVKLAARNGVKILPVALKTDFWGYGRFLKTLGPLRRRQTVRFRFGEAQKVEGKARDIHESIIAFIQTHLRAWQESAIAGA